MKRIYTHFPTFLWIFSVLLFVDFGSLAQGRLTTIQPVTDGYDYIAYIPAGYDELQENYPVLVYLHGGQGIKDGFYGAGDTKDGLRNFQFGPPNLINNLIATPRWPTYTKWPTNEFIVIMPHLPKDPNIQNHNNQLWDPFKVEKVINHAFANLMLDENRFYMTGISLGAKGVYDYVLLDAPDRIPAAIIPISGNAEPFSPDLCGIKDIYLWALHGSDDTQVPLGKSNTQPSRFGSKVLVEEYNNCNPSIKARLDTLQGVAHNSWNEYYDGTTGYNIYQWLSEHSKNKNPNLNPYVNAGLDDIKILLDANPVLTLYGYGYDSESTNDLTFTWSSIGNDENMVYLTPPDKKTVVVKFLQAGEFEFNLEVDDKTGKTSSDQVIVKVLTDAGSNQVISRLEVKEGENSFRTLESVDRIDNPPGTEVVIRAVDESGAEGVRFTLGENNNYSTHDYRADGIYPSNPPLSGYKWRPKTGEYIFSVTPHELDKPARLPGITKQYAIYVNEDPPIILPVEFLDINATWIGNKINIIWSTASEQGNDFFTIERSPIASDHFETIGTQKGAGDSNALKKYTFTDFAPLAGDAYYRIKQTDFDGKSDHSKIVKVNGSGAFEASLFPNPTERGFMFIRLSTADPYTPVAINVMDAIGNLVYQDKLAPDKLMQVDGHKLVVGNKLNPGLYFVIIEQGDHKVQKKLIVQ